MTTEITNDRRQAEEGKRAEEGREEGKDGAEAGDKAPVEVRAEKVRPIEQSEVANATKCQGVAGVMYDCPDCSKVGLVPDPHAAVAWLKGIAVVARCATCSKVFIVVNAQAEKKREQRIISPNGNDHHVLSRKV